MSPSFHLKENLVKNHQIDKTYRTYHLRTLVNKELKSMHNGFYENNKKVFPLKFLQNSDFDALSLAAWYMGDGGKKGNVPSLYTYGFGFNGNLEILKFIFDRFQVKGEMKVDLKNIRGKDKVNFISFKKEEAKKFFSIVSPHMIPHFSYKLPTQSLL